MASGQRAMYTGADNILYAYKTVRNDSPYYSVWQGRDLRYAFNENDLDKGVNQLETLLAVIDNNGDSDLYTIKIHPKPEKGYISDKTTVIGSMPVRVCELDNGVIGSVTHGHELPPVVYNLLKSVETNTQNMVANQTLIEKRLEALEKMPVEGREPDTLDRIGSILEKPGMMEMLAPVISGFMQKFMPQPNIRMSGIQPDVQEPVQRIEPVKQSNSVGMESFLNTISDIDYDTLDGHLAVLSQNCDVVADLGLLANLSKNNPAMFKMLLDNLKAK